MSADWAAALFAGLGVLGAAFVWVIRLLMRIEHQTTKTNGTLLSYGQRLDTCEEKIEALDNRCFRLHAKA